MDRQMSRFTLNQRGWRIADRMEAQADRLRIVSKIIGGGARLIDAGIAVTGGLGAGIAISELCMGGLGNVSFTPVPIDGENWPGVTVWTDHPATACLASQYAGWTIQVDKYFAMGSGPLRAHARVETELFAKLGYAEEAPHGVLMLESRKPPTDEVVEWVAKKARLSPPQLTFVVAPTASLAGGVQIVARILEVGLHKMDTLGFDVRKIVSGTGTAPMPPVSKDDLRGIGRTNDCILYGGQAHYTVQAGDEELAELAPKVPASASRDYGTPFYEVFQRYNGNFYQVDPLLFSPAMISLTSATTGRTFTAGKLNPKVLKKSLFE